MSEPADLARLRRYGPETDAYTISVITDEDEGTQVELEDGQIAWQSTVRYDRLLRYEDPDGAVRYEVETDKGGEYRLISLIAEAGRGAEFSELAWFGGRLLAFDDRTGLACEIRAKHQLIPRQILITGSGDERFKGFKSEWATLKGDQLIVGSHGKNDEQRWIKAIDRDYRVSSIDWHGPYRRMREALGVEGTPGYVIHEAAEWHPLRERWYFFPRKISTEPFEEAIDERERGANTLVIADERFEDVQTMTIGERVPERGVSSFKVIPGHPNECVGLKSVEIGDSTETYLFCFDLQGHLLKEDTFLGAYKCEGVEIL
jgi:soluble calcium-activated nucleotidase 1